MQERPREGEIESERARARERERERERERVVGRRLIDSYMYIVRPVKSDVSPPT